MSQDHKTQLMTLTVEIRRDPAVSPSDAWLEASEFIRDAMEHGADTRPLAADPAYEIEYAGGNDCQITIDIVDAWSMDGAGSSDKDRGAGDG